MPRIDTATASDWRPRWHDTQHDYADTMPSLPMPLEAAHAASELVDDDERRPMGLGLSLLLTLAYSVSAGLVLALGWQVWRAW